MFPYGKTSEKNSENFDVIGLVDVEKMAK